MEFINYNRRDVSSPGTASTGIKNVKTMTGLRLSLADGKGEFTFSGLGSYLEVDVKNKGTSKKVKIPFFSAYKKDKFVNIDGFAFVNPLTKKVVKSVVAKNVPTFELTDFQAAATAELNDRMASLGTTPTDLTTKTDLENKRDNVIANAKKKDSDELVREEIKYLNELIEKGLNLRICTNDNQRKAAIKKYCDQFERLMTLKAQLKTFTWSQKKGIRKLNNKVLKRVGAGVAAVAVAAGLTAGRIFEFPKNIKEGIESWFKSSKTKVTQTATPEVTELPSVTVAPTVTPVPEVKPEPTLEIQVAPTESKYNFDTEMYTIAIESNYDNFSEYRSLIEEYGFDYNKLVAGYTFVEHAKEMDTSKFSSSTINNYIDNARTMISLLVSKGQYNQLPIRQETLGTIQGCLNGNTELGISFVEQACESKEPLLDMITVGELESYLIYEEALYNFNVNIYYKEIEEYKNKLLNGTLEVASIEPSKIKTLGESPLL